VAPQLSSDKQHNYTSKTRQAGCANEQSMYSLMSMIVTILYVVKQAMETRQVQIIDICLASIFTR